MTISLLQENSNQQSISNYGYHYNHSMEKGGRSIIRKVTRCSEEAPIKPKPPDTF